MTSPAQHDHATAGSPPGSPATTSSGHVNAILFTLSFCGIVVSLMQTLVVPLLADLPTLLHTSASNASWVVTATLLAGAVCTPVMGRLGDMYGKRRILVVSLVVLVAGSVLCALSSSLLVVVIGRLLQGASFGVIPLGISIMRDEMPPERLGSAVGLMSATLGIGGAIGLPLAAVVAQNADWHMLFWGAGALGAVDVALVLMFVPRSAVTAPAAAGGRFDLVGALGMSAGLVCLLLGITKGSDWGWGSTTTLGLFVAAVVVLVLWGVFELRVRDPLVDLRITATPKVLFTNLTSVVVGFALYAQSLVFPQILQLPSDTGYGLGRSMVTAGLCMAPAGLVMMVVSPVSAKLSAARGPKVSLMVGTAVIGVGYALSTIMMDSAWKIVVATMISMTGVALAYAAMPALIMQAVPPSQTGAATGLNTLMRSIGTSTSSAVVGMVLANMTTAHHGTRVATKNAFTVSLWLGCGAAAVGLVVALFIPGRRARTADVLVGSPVAAGADSPATTR